jgi:hypothetical protein
VPLGGWISYEHLKAVVKAREHFFFYHKSSDPRVIDTSEIDFADRSEQLQEVPRRLSWPRARSIFCRLDPRARTETVASDWCHQSQV